VADLLVVADDDKHGPSLSFACEGLPAAEAALAAGYEPDGHFWEGVARYAAPDHLAALELDCEGDIFTAHGDHELLEQVRTVLETYVGDGDALASLIARAEADGHFFD
jgi:hypothetical protein